MEPLSQPSAAVEVSPSARASAAPEGPDGLRAVLDHAPMVLWMTDAEGVFTFSEGKGLESLGLRPGEVVGRSVFEVYRDVPAVLEEVRRALAGEARVCTVLVSEIWFETRLTPLRAGDGAVQGIVGVSVDVTERHRVQEALTSSLSLLRATLDSTADGLLVVDRAGDIVAHNQMAAELLRVPAETLEGGREDRLVAAVLRHLRDRASFLDTMRRVQAEPETHSFDVLEFRDGRVLERYSRPQRVGSRIVGRVWSFRDVTEQRGARAELQRRESQLARTQQIAGLGSWEWEIATGRVHWSDEMYRVYGIEPGSVEITVATFLDLVHPDDRAALQAEIACSLELHLPFSVEHRIVRPDGSVRAIHARGEVMTDEGGAIRMIGTGQDITERKAADEALRVSENRFRAIFEQFPFSIQLFAPDGTTLEVNRAWREFFSLEPEQLRDFNPFTDPQLADLAPLMRRALAGEPVALPPTLFDARRAVGLPEEERTGEDPGPRWVQAFMCPVRGDGDTVREVFIVHQDVTKEKQAEEVLRRSNEELERAVEERTVELAETNAALEEEIAERERAEAELRERSGELEAIFGALPDLYFRLAADGSVLDYRASADNLYAPPDVFLGRPVFEVMPPETAELIRGALDEVHRTGRPAWIEYSLPLPQGEGFFEARFMPFEDGQVITVVRDITDRTRAERALQKREEHFRLLIENSSDVATILGPDGTNWYQSPSITGVLGYAPEEMIGTRAFDRIHPDDLQVAAGALRRAVENPGTSTAAEFRYRDKSGGWRRLEARAKTLLPDSAAAGVVVNSRDVTARYEAEQALRDATAEAERANRAKSEFLSRMSHELRTPLNSILGFAQVLARKELPADQRRGVDHILKAGRHLLTLINEVLDISRIEANSQELAVEALQARAVVQEAISLVQPLASEYTCRVEAPEIDPEWVVRADRQRLIQVLLNLLSNAIKYNRPDGLVRVTCDERAGEDEGSAGWLRIGVHDTGWGIAPERMGELFTPFARLGAEQTSVEGTGLGLALSQRLVQAMNGSIRVESVLGQGSSFWVELPLGHTAPSARADTRAESAPAGPAEAGDEREATLLYVEDNLANLALVETVLAARPNLRLVPALRGRIGLDLAVQESPDLVLLDLHLPDISGVEVLERLRADERTRDIPVVVVSADATPASIERLRACGATGYLTKPIEIAQLLETIDGLLAARAEPPADAPAEDAEDTV